jgi:signal transduction histidine kinase
LIPRFKSILGRIIWLQIITLSMAAIALPLAAYLLLDSTAVNFENQTLSAHARTIADYLQAQPNGSWTLDLPQDLRTFYARGFEGLRYTIFDSNGRVLFSSTATKPPLPELSALTNSPVYFQRSNAGSAYFAGNFPFQRDERTIWVQVTQNLEHPDVIIDDIVGDFLRRVGWFTIPIVVVLLIVDIFVVRRALRPVITASEMARALHPTRLDVRLPEENVPSEVLPLIEAINHALTGLEHAFRVQRNFTADAAHELRTPLSVLRIRLESLGDQTGAAALRNDVDAMTHTVNQLLEIAELESTVIGQDERADLRQVSAEVVELLAPIALAQSREIALTGTEHSVWIRGNAPMLFLAIRNLVENAVRYTNAGSTVEVEVDPQGIVRVIDEGPGVPDEDRELIFHRFWRRDRTRSGGAGLGLSIVSSVASAHSGSVSVADRPGGGAVFCLDLSRSLKSPDAIDSRETGGVAPPTVVKADDCL